MEETTRCQNIGPDKKECVRHGTALFPVACYDTDLQKGPVAWHWHTELEAVLVAQGTAVLAAGQERYRVAQGGGFFINSGVLHAMWDARQPPAAAQEAPQTAALQDGMGCRLCSAVFHPRLVAGGFDSVFWQEYLRPLTQDGAKPFVLLDGGEAWHAQALDAVKTAWESSAAQRPGYEFEVREALSRLVLLLCRHRAAAEVSASEKSLREEERLKKMLRFIEEHYDAELTAAQIAQSARISESECLRCFRRTIGTPPSQYVKQLRVQKAAQLLCDTGRGTAEIGALCGFQDASYFARTFRALKGCTPTEFRRRSKENA